MHTIWMILLGIFVFCGAAIVDFADVNNQQAVQDNDAHRAARYSVGMYVVGMTGFVSVLTISPWFVIPECLGLYVGSLIAVRRRVKATIPKAFVVTSGEFDSKQKPGPEAWGFGVQPPHPTQPVIERRL